MTIKLKVLPLEDPHLPQHGDYIIIWTPSGGCWTTQFDYKKYQAPEPGRGGFYHWSRFPHYELWDSPWLNQREKNEDDIRWTQEVEAIKWGDQ